jgi:hypothetical protein
VAYIVLSRKRAVWNQNRDTWHRISMPSYSRNFRQPTRHAEPEAGLPGRSTHHVGLCADLPGVRLENKAQLKAYTIDMLHIYSAKLWHMLHIYSAKLWRGIAKKLLFCSALIYR